MLHLSTVNFIRPPPTLAVWSFPNRLGELQGEINWLRRQGESTSHGRGMGQWAGGTEVHNLENGLGQGKTARARAMRTNLSGFFPTRKKIFSKKRQKWCLFISMTTAFFFVFHQEKTTSHKHRKAFHLNFCLGWTMQTLSGGISRDLWSERISLCHFLQAFTCNLVKDKMMPMEKPATNRKPL